MSGGHFNYMYYQLDETYCGKMEDIELNEMMKDLIELLQDLEWYKSADTGYEDYRESVNDFKKKWFNRSKFDIEEMIDDKIDELRSELKESLGYLNENS